MSSAEDTLACRPTDFVQFNGNRMPLQNDAPDATNSVVKHRQASLELVRLIACLGIVWFHCGAPGASVGYGGLPALIMLSVALATVPGKPRPPMVTVRKQAVRLLLPWVFWCAIYGIWRVMSAIALRHPISTEFRAWMLLTGPAIHLWYLPFAFCFTCTVRLLHKRRTS